MYWRHNGSIHTVSSKSCSLFVNMPKKKQKFCQQTSSYWISCRCEPEPVTLHILQSLRFIANKNWSPFFRNPPRVCKKIPILVDMRQDCLSRSVLALFDTEDGTDSSRSTEEKLTKLLTAAVRAPPAERGAEPSAVWRAVRTLTVMFLRTLCLSTVQLSNLSKLFWKHTNIPASASWNQRHGGGMMEGEGEEEGEGGRVFSLLQRRNGDTCRPACERAAREEEGQRSEVFHIVPVQEAGLKSKCQIFTWLSSFPASTRLL